MQIGAVGGIMRKKTERTEKEVEDLLQCIAEKSEGIAVYREGEVKTCARGSAAYDQILDAWKQMTSGARPMPAFGVSIDALTRKEKDRGLWVEFLFSEEQVCDGMPFEKLLVQVAPEYRGFNLHRYSGGGYNGRCFYLDLDGDMSVFERIVLIASNPEMKAPDEREGAFYVPSADGKKKISRIVLGTALAPYSLGTEENALLDALFAAGITAYDTARVYGKAEECLGQWIKARKNREKIWVLTKCGHPDAEWHKRINEREMRKDLETSLSALHTDYVDALLLHRDDPDVPVLEPVEILNQFCKEKKVREIGVSNWTHERIAEANDYAATHGLRPFTVSSPSFSLADQLSDVLTDGVWLAGKGHASARDWYRKTQMPVFAYSSLARGFFAGKVTDAETASQYLDALSMRAYGCERNYARARRCIELAREKGVAPAQVALSWVFRQGLNVFAITGTSKAERIRQNIDAFFLDLSKEECRYLCGEE